jgi:hypothetical protein
MVAFPSLGDDVRTDPPAVVVERSADEDDGVPHDRIIHQRVRQASFASVLKKQARCLSHILRFATTPGYDVAERNLDLFRMSGTRE